MPGLSSFCVTAAVCIAFIFVLQVSWTVAWLVLDQRRIEADKHGIFPCITIPESETEESTKISQQGDKLIQSYSNLFKYWPFKVNLVYLPPNIFGHRQMFYRCWCSL